MTAAPGSVRQAYDTVICVRVTVAEDDADPARPARTSHAGHDSLLSAALEKAAPTTCSHPAGNVTPGGAVIVSATTAFGPVSSPGNGTPPCSALLASVAEPSVMEHLLQ